MGIVASLLLSSQACLGAVLCCAAARGRCCAGWLSRSVTVDESFITSIPIGTLGAISEWQENELLYHSVTGQQSLPIWNLVSLAFRLHTRLFYSREPQERCQYMRQ